MASNAENVFIWWRHHDTNSCELQLHLYYKFPTVAQAAFSVLDRVGSIYKPIQRLSLARKDRVILLAYLYNTGVWHEEGCKTYVWGRKEMLGFGKWRKEALCNIKCCDHILLSNCFVWVCMRTLSSRSLKMSQSLLTTYVTGDSFVTMNKLDDMKETVCIKCWLLSVHLLVKTEDSHSFCSCTEQQIGAI